LTVDDHSDRALDDQAQLLVVVTMLWHVREWFEIEDSDSKPLAVKRAGDHPAPNLKGQARSSRLLDDGPGLDLDPGTERERGGREGGPRWQR
jgi:hypothetical protein